MFEFFKSKDKKPSALSEQQIADEIFSQILKARDEAKSGGIIDEKVFNDRLNHMYTAGYLIGYVDQCLSEAVIDDAEKKEKSRLIFEKMFPGTGFDFVRAKLVLRQQATDTTNDSASYSGTLEAARHFDLGMEAAQGDIEYQTNSKVVPTGLKDFLLLGVVKGIC